MLNPRAALAACLLALSLALCQAATMEELLAAELQEALRRQEAGETVVMPQVQPADGERPAGGGGGGGAMGPDDGAEVGGGGGDESSGVAATCDETVLVNGSCSIKGESNYHTTDLTYSEGIFSGSITTNSCPKTVVASGDPPQADCITQTFPTTTATPAATPLLGRIGMTFEGESINGPFEAGFGVGFMCESGFCDAGIDLTVCDAQLNATCTGEREDVYAIGDTISICGGHADPYHYHRDLVCHYDVANSAVHAGAVGVGLDGRVLYGRWEGGDTLPTLDVCNGHIGVVPADETLGIASAEVYHYHTTDEPPYTIGCYGPVADIAACRALYTDTDRGCGGEALSLSLADTFGTDIYDADVDTWCPCYGADDGIVTVTSEAVTTEEPTTTSVAAASSSALLSPGWSSGLVVALFAAYLGWA